MRGKYASAWDGNGSTNFPRAVVLWLFQPRLHMGLSQSGLPNGFQYCCIYTLYSSSLLFNASSFLLWIVLCKLKRAISAVCQELLSRWGWRAADRCSDVQSVSWSQNHVLTNANAGWLITVDTASRGLRPFRTQHDGDYVCDRMLVRICCLSLHHIQGHSISNGRH